MEIDCFISGEKFQGIADVSVIPEGDGLGESNCGFVEKQQHNNNYTAFYYNVNTQTLPDYVQNARVIFVNNYTLAKFFKVIFPRLNGRYVFISHNSDEAFTQEYCAYLDSEKVIGWFSQNVLTHHPKLYTIPIGIANQQYEHGNLQLIKNIIDNKNNKEFLVYKNFDIYTNFHVRSNIDNITSQNGFRMNPKMRQEDYLTNLSKSIFCISPPGNGVDCHRNWECLYLKTIPIIQYSPCYEQFKHLPFLFIEDWHEVTPQFLESNKDKFTTNYESIEELDINFWKNKIFTLYDNG